MTKNNKNNTHSKENNEGTEQNKRRGRRTSLTHSSKQSVEYSKQRRKSVNSLGTKGKGQLATVQSIQEIITDIRKLPTVSLEAEEDHSTWTRDRRHSEPYSHNKMNRSHSKKGDTLDTIEEIPSNPSNLFQKENKDEKNELVSPSEKQMTRRNRSKSGKVYIMKAQENSVLIFFYSTKCISSNTRHVRTKKSALPSLSERSGGISCHTSAHAICRCFESKRPRQLRCPCSV